MRNTFVDTLMEIADRNPNVWLLCGDLGFSVLEPFATKFSRRFINVGVAEQNMAGIAAGIALTGKTVFIYSIGNFPTLRCLEQLRNDVCYHGADVKVVAVGGGYAYGSQGYTHHAIEDVAVMTALPGMEIFVPCDPVEVRSITHAIATSGRTAYLRLSRTGEPALGQDMPEDVRSARLLRAGTDAMMLASGPIASACLTAADELAADGISVCVASVLCLKPFDERFLREAAATMRLLVTVEEHILHGGLYAAAAGCLAQSSHHAPLLGLGLSQAGEVSTAGGREALLARAGLSAEAIAQRIRASLVEVQANRN
jgi:transketolase